MRASGFLAAAALAACAGVGIAQEAAAPGLGEVVVNSNRLNARYADQGRPVIGLRRQADSAVMTISISSDTRDEAVRKREIHTVLLSALDRATAAGVELVTGNFELIRVTKENYKELPFQYGGRVDTNRVDLMAKVKLAGSAVTAAQRLDAFVKNVPGSGRGVIDKSTGLTLTIINPDQYREAIVKLIAEDARKHAAAFGPEYGVNINGIDGQVSWSQISSTEVFLYLPYRYTIVPK